MTLCFGYSVPVRANDALRTQENRGNGLIRNVAVEKPSSSNTEWQPFHHHSQCTTQSDMSPKAPRRQRTELQDVKTGSFTKERENRQPDLDTVNIATKFCQMIETSFEFPKEYMNKRITIDARQLIFHHGTDDTLDYIDNEFEKCYVGKKLYMIGYFGRVGSDHLLLVDACGTVYRADDTILHVVGSNVSDYFRSGALNLGFYDYYGHLDLERSRKCSGGSYADEEKFLRNYLSVERTSAE